VARAFISYSRRDREFITRLLPALRRLDHEVWVDTDDIRPSAEWMEDIRRAIRESDCFLFILSAPSITSRVCLQELECATSHAKKVIPVLIEPVDAALVPSALAKLNWLAIDNSDGFDDRVASLSDAINTDLEWVGIHTRLVQRSHEWNERGRDRNRLLRGEALVEAQKWLAQADATTRVATKLQREYIASSIADAARRRRVAIGLTVAASVAGIVLSAAIVMERMGRLDENAVKLSQALANRALQHIDQQLDMALLLSLAALERANTAAARASLLDGLEHIPALVTFLHEHKGAIRSLALSPDGATMVSGGCAHPGKELCREGEIYRWDFPSGRTLGRLGASLTSDVRGLAFSPDGRTIAASAGDTIHFWDAASQTVRGSIERAFAKRVNSIAFSPDGQWLATATELNPVRLWHADSLALDDWAPEFRAAQSVGPSNDVSFDPSGHLLAAATDRWIYVWDLPHRRRVDHLFGARERVYVDEPGRGAIANAVSFTSAGAILVAGSAAGDVTFWNVKNGTRVGLFTAQDEVWNLATTEDGNTMAAGAGQRIHVWHTDGSTPIWDTEVRNLDGHSAKVTAMVLNAAGRWMATGDEDGRLIVWDLLRRSTLGRVAASPLEQFPTINAAAATADGRRIAVSTGDRVVLQEVDHSGAATQESVCTGARVHSVAFSSDGSLLACGDESGRVRIVDPKTPAHERVFVTDSGSINAVAISIDGRFLAAGACTASDANKRCLGSVFVWDIASGNVLRRHVEQSAEISGLAFGPSELVSGNRNGEILIYRDPAASSVPAILSDSRRSITAIAVSPDGRTIVSGQSDGTVRLWDQPEGRALGSAVALHRGPVRYLALAGKTTIVSVAADSRVDWSANLEDWVSTACRTAHRNLTRTEWDAYVGSDLPYRRLCGTYPSGTGAPRDAEAAIYGIGRMDRVTP
jgi:WD40 repeat protein